MRYTSMRILFVSAGPCIRNNDTQHIITGEEAAHSAIEMAFVVDSRLREWKLLGWLEQFLPLLDVRLAKFGFGTSPSCENRFALVARGSHSPAYRVYSAVDTTGDFYTVEDFLGIIHDFRYAVPYFAIEVPPTLADIRAAFSMVKMRPSTRNCLVSRNMAVMSSAKFPHPGDAMSKNLEEQLRQSDVTLHTFIPGNSFKRNGVSNGVGRSTTTGFFVFPNDNCASSALLTTQLEPSDGPMSQLSMVALNLSGSVWERSPGDARTAISCSLLNVITNQMKKMVASCFYCHCSSSGRERCISSGSKEDECRCELQDGAVSSRSCRTHVGKSCKKTQ